ATADGDLSRWLSHYRIGGNNPAALRRMLARCRDLDIQVVLLAPPLAEPHRRYYKPEIESAFMNHIKSLVADFGCQFVDSRDWAQDRLFRDHHHLFPDGGDYYSRLLTYRVLVPLWRDMPPSGTGASGNRGA